MNEYEGSPRDFATIIAATFPQYRRKKVRVRATGKITFHDLNWSGGTRTEYRACTLDGYPLGNSAKYNSLAPWGTHGRLKASLSIFRQVRS